MQIYDNVGGEEKADQEEAQERQRQCDSGKIQMPIQRQRREDRPEETHDERAPSPH
ncbi:hypothetical protein AOR01nite_21790 [Acetobacter orleanensis]|uniref:Uncharacterized protein n=1 Tax=Acetobacter orleanensis TaxID=104099 RepID=A0A4Y3TPE3_9PROT|nr:hypothetical protein Abol_047_013 [Acetobacter orleanensis JCM 7639]GEB83702.1 hypothetical protein AOR01nite_21790 [Acetobacter orleanensis]